MRSLPLYTAMFVSPCRLQNSCAHRLIPPCSDFFSPCAEIGTCFLVSTLLPLADQSGKLPLEGKGGCFTPKYRAEVNCLPKGCRALAKPGVRSWLWPCILLLFLMMPEFASQLWPSAPGHQLSSFSFHPSKHL